MRTNLHIVQVALSFTSTCNFTFTYDQIKPFQATFSHTYNSKTCGTNFVSWNKRFHYLVLRKGWPESYTIVKTRCIWSTIETCPLYKPRDERKEIVRSSLHKIIERKRAHMETIFYYLFSLFRWNLSYLLVGNKW